VIGYNTSDDTFMRWGAPQSPGGRVCLCVFFFRFDCLCCYICFPLALCAESAVKQQANKQTFKNPVEWSPPCYPSNFSTVFRLKN